MSMTRSIIGMFGQSPIRPLQQHMVKIFKCAKTLEPFFMAVFKADWPQAEAKHLIIFNLEQEADEQKKDLRLHLPKSLFMPMSRSDVLELIKVQDAIANLSKDIAGIVLGRQMHFPEILQDDFMNFLQRCLDAVAQANKAIHELDELLETGFQGREAEIVQEMVTKLNEIEHDTDVMQAAVRHKLFALENKLPPVDVIFLYKIFDWTGELANRAESVGGRLLMLLAR